MYAIKLKNHDIWAGRERITYFVRDDMDFVFRQVSLVAVLPFGVPVKRRRIWGSTEEIRRSLRECARETVINQHGFIGLLGSGKALGKFSNYEVHDLVTGVVHPLDDVMIKLV